MKTTKEYRQDDISAQAAAWVGRVYSGNASQEDEMMLDAWLQADERHAAEYFRMLEVWDEVGIAEFEALTQDPVEQAPPSPLRGRMHQFVAVAALLLVAVMGAWMLAPAREDLNPGVGVYATAVGETRELALADGSTVTLNTGSKLFLEFNDTMRRAILDSGEAFFDVESDPDRPFVVTAGEQSVTVLGTRFNVQRRGGRLTVAVVEGAVAVHENIEPERLEANARQLVTQPDDTFDPGFAHFRLEAGTVGTFEKSEELSGMVETADANDHQAWRQGIVRFSDSSLTDVVTELSRYSTTDIVIEGDAVADMSISGVFHHDDLDGVFKGLEAMLPIAVDRDGDRIIIRADSE